jgi:SAM-dependent MidA family methyltransferase
MEEALYSQLGFFNTDQVRSDKEGDFLTSPEVSKYFGKIIRNWINSESNLKNIIEIGSGTGSLIEQIGIKEITAVELSSSARKELIKKGINTHINFDELASKTSDLIFGNEILDNIPCSIGLYKDEVWYEKVVLFEEASLAYDLKPMRNEELDWVNKNSIVPNENYEFEIQVNIDKFLNSVIKKINPGKILLFDYGYEQQNRDKRMYNSLLRTYKNHHLSVDPIEDPGNIDITYDVNFSSISRELKYLGYDVTLKLQRDFLLDNGFNIFFDELQEKYIYAEGIEKLKINSELNGMKAIIDSNGLGGFYCLIAEKL